MQNISTDRVIENGWVEDYKVVVGRRIGVPTFEGLSESKVYRLKDGKCCKVFSMRIVTR